MRPLLSALGLTLGGASLALVGFAAGRLSAAPTPATPAYLEAPLLVQAPPDQTQPGDPRELLPLPGPGRGEGQGAQPGECPIYLYEDGRLFQLAPGQPLPGDGGSPELFPLEPTPRFLPTPPLPTPRSLPPRLADAGSTLSTLSATRR